MELPAALHALFLEAIETYSALSDASPFQARDAAHALLDHAMLTAGFPVHDAHRPEDHPAPGHPVPWDERIVFRAASLTETQRAVAMFLARHRALPTFRYPLPGSPWAIRRWLGIDAPGVLFETRADGRTPYEALRVCQAQYQREKAMRAYLATLPAMDRVQALVDLSLITSDSAFPHAGILHSLLPEIDDSLGPWARARAQWLIDERSRGHFPALILEDLLPVIYVALMRAGLSDSPEFDALLPLSRWCSVSDTWFTETQCALLNALPEERREAALLASTKRGMPFADGVRALARLLPFFPYPGVAAYILEQAHETRYPSDALEAVRVAAETNRAIAALYEAHMAKLGSIPKLRLVSFTPRPALSTLNQAQQLQLEVRGRPWNMSAAQMLAAYVTGEHELNLIVIASEEGAQFDAWLNEGNEGSIFRAGTTEEVAWMSQGGTPECEDKALLTALRDALAGRHLNAMREASFPGAEGPWAAYRAACERSDEGGSKALVSDSSESEEDVPF